jgi:hypothetical protein
MDFRKAVRRRSVNTAEDAGPSSKTSSPSAAAERKAKRYTWGSNPVRSLNHATSEESRQDQVSMDTSALNLNRSISSASLQLLPLDVARETVPDLRTRPRSAGDASISGSSLNKALPPQPGALPTIMEKKYVEISTALQSRNVPPKVKRWDAKTRTTSPWDSLRRVNMSSTQFSQQRLTKSFSGFRIVLPARQLLDTFLWKGPVKERAFS